MKKLIRAVVGCIAIYYAIDAIGAVSMACAWRNLVNAGNVQAANALDDTFHKTYCKRNQKVFDFEKKYFSEQMKEKN